MQSTVQAVLALLLGVTLLTIGNALLGTLVSLRMALEGFPRPLAGLVMSAYFAGFVFGSIKGPRVIERVGHIRAFAAFAATFGVAATVQALVVAPLPWIVCRAAVGFAVAGELMVAESWLNTAASAHNRGRILSLYMIAIYWAFGTGQFALVLGDPAGLDLFLLVTLFLMASIIPIVLTRSVAPSQLPTPPLGIRRIWKMAPLGLVGALVAGVAVGAVQSIGPQFARDIGLSVPRISVFMGTFFLSGLLLQWPAGRYSDRTDRRRVLAAMALLSALALGAIAVLDDRPFPVLLGLAVVGGGAVATLYALSVAHANDRLHAESVVSITATLLLANGIGAIAGPIAATLVMVAVGASGLFYTAAVPCAGLALYALYRMQRFERVEQEPWQSVAQTTPVVLEIDPRAVRVGDPSR